MKIEKDTEVDRESLMLCLGIKTARLSQLTSSGVISQSSHGSYNLVENLKSHRMYIKSGSPAAQDEDNVIDLNAERARKTKAEADRLERLNEIDNGKYIAADEVGRDISDAVGVCAKILGSLKINLARIAPELPNRALDLIEKEQAKMLTAMIELDESYPEKDGDD